jgi:hypothetical protein
MDHTEEIEDNAATPDSRTPLLDPDRHSDTCSTLTTNEAGPVKDDSVTVGNSVLPEDSVLGRNIGWSSAYILV